MLINSFLKPSKFHEFPQEVFLARKFRYTIPWLCSLLLIIAGLTGCDKPHPPRSLYLLDIGLIVELSDASIDEGKTTLAGLQYRAAHLLPGGKVAIKNISWPSEGSLDVTTGPDPRSKPKGRSVLSVLLNQNGRRSVSLGEIILDGATPNKFNTVKLSWNDLKEGEYDLVLELKSNPGSKGSWLCDCGVLHNPNPFESVDREKNTKPSFVLILIDTLRADHLGCYGYNRDTSPGIDALAKEGLLFSNFCAQASWTKPSTATILTSLRSYDHGAVNRFDLLSDRVWTISEELKEEGYKTGAFIANGWIGNPHFNFNQGYDHFMKVNGVDYDEKGMADEVMQRAIEWVALNGEKPFFLFIHLIDPHSPYTPPPDLAARFDRGYTGDVKPYHVDPKNKKDPSGFSSDTLTPEDLNHLIDLYDAEIAFADSEINSFMLGLEALDLRSSTVVMVTSDHGEEFHDHDGLEHGKTLYEEQLRVPLIIAGPGVDAKRRTFDPIVRHLDIAPMILGIAGLRKPPAFMGRDPLAKGARPLNLCVSDLDRVKWRAVSVRANNLKLIRNYKPKESVMLFDLKADPMELNDISKEFPEHVKNLSAVTESYEAVLTRPGLYIACKGDDKIKKFDILLTGDHPVEECLRRMGELHDRFKPAPELKGVRFLLKVDAPGDIDLFYIVSELKGKYNLVVKADGKPLDSGLVKIGQSGTMKGSWPLKVEDQFAQAVVSPSPPIDLETFMIPGSIAIFRILPVKGFGGIPEEDVKELQRLGYLK